MLTVRHPFINTGDEIQRQPHAQKVDNLIQEYAISHNDSAIVGCLLQSVVADAVGGVESWSSAENGEFTIHVSVDTRDERERWKDDVGYKGGYDCGEGCCYSV